MNLSLSDSTHWSLAGSENGEGDSYNDDDDTGEKHNTIISCTRKCVGRQMLHFAVLNRCIAGGKQRSPRVFKKF